MEQILEFAGNHPFIVSGFILVATLLMIELSFGNKSNINPSAATHLINQENAVVIDVRPSNDYKAGHIINAISMPMSGFSSSMEKLKKYKDQTIIMNCRSGAQSNSACRQLKQAGYEKVFNLKGGIMAWQSAGLPVSKGKNKK